MTEITLQFINEQLAAIQAEQANIRIDIGDLKKAAADLHKQIVRRKHNDHARLARAQHNGETHT